jgi:restriction system protein
MSYLVAAALGALIVVACQWIVQSTSPSAHRRVAWSKAHRLDGSFRSYVGLIVPDERGTTEIDEVLVTPAGVFVVEKKDFNAWIYGSENDEYWTAVYPNSEKYRFQNPIRQNYRHLKALESFLKLPRSSLTPVVVFSRRSRLMTALPPQVMADNYLEFVHSVEKVAISPVQFDSICAGLDALTVESDATSRDRHVKGLHVRFASTTHCPKCGGDLVKRQSRSRGDEGTFFYGCTNFPSCRYVRSLDAT